LAIKAIQADATYIVTGGNNGIGLETVKWLCEKDARSIAIISRSGLKSEQQSQLTPFISKGITILSYSCDVGDAMALNKVLNEIRASQPTVKGVMHAAGILDDALFENITEQTYSATFHPKVNGAWNLHNYFQDAGLDVFVVFSSVAGILGSAGQASYAAANTFLDALMHFRNNNGLAGTSISWGNIAEIGLAARQENRGARLTEQGLNLIYPKDLYVYFDALLLSKEPHLIAVDIDFEKWAAGNPKIKTDFFYSEVLSPAEKNKIVKFNLASFTSTPMVVRHIKDKIKSSISAATKMQVHKIKDDDTFKSIGIDSLLALQIKNKIQQFFDIPLGISAIWAYPTVNKLANFIAQELKAEEYFASAHNSPDRKTEDEQKTTANGIEEEVNNLSLDELLKQLNEKVN
jgi:acyl carrier protein/NADP-dependent 3-hydroxy acid dehydrogenase YdfG